MSTVSKASSTAAVMVAVPRSRLPQKVTLAVPRIVVTVVPDDVDLVRAREAAERRRERDRGAVDELALGVVHLGLDQRAAACLLAAAGRLSAHDVRAGDEVEDEARGRARLRGLAPAGSVAARQSHPEEENAQHQSPWHPSHRLPLRCPRRWRGSFLDLLARPRAPCPSGPRCRPPPAPCPSSR